MVKKFMTGLWLFIVRFTMIISVSAAFELGLRASFGPNGAISLAGILLIIFLTFRFTGPKRKERRIRYDPLSYPVDGHDFEVWVARRLRDFGWKAEVTQGSGDQGIDVIARRGGLKLGIQCKRYNGAVGNKAVQEAYAGCAFYKLDKAAVVSTGKYTRSARELAASLGVLLLETPDLQDLHKRNLRQVMRK